MSERYEVFCSINAVSFVFAYITYVFIPSFENVLIYNHFFGHYVVTLYLKRQAHSIHSRYEEFIFTIIVFIESEASAVILCRCVLTCLKIDTVYFLRYFYVNFFNCIV